PDFRDAINHHVLAIDGAIIRIFRRCASRRPVADRLNPCRRPARPAPAVPAALERANPRDRPAAGNRELHLNISQVIFQVALTLRCHLRAMGKTARPAQAGAGFA
ncbi:MAG: hypothetical protein Q8S27_18065, partial [Hoeflea sp.]|nr:hypothetical protein [Hoeflea sp.]